MFLHCWVSPNYIKDTWFGCIFISILFHFENLETCWLYALQRLRLFWKLGQCSHSGAIGFNWTYSWVWQNLHFLLRYFGYFFKNPTHTLSERKVTLGEAMPANPMGKALTFIQLTFMKIPFFSTKSQPKTVLWFLLF